MSYLDKCHEIVQGRAVGCAGVGWRQPRWENAAWVKTWGGEWSPWSVSGAESLVEGHQVQRPQAALCPECRRGEGRCREWGEPWGRQVTWWVLYSHWLLCVGVAFLCEPDAMSLELLSSGWLNVTVLNSHLATGLRFRCRGLAVALYKLLENCCGHPGKAFGAHGGGLAESSREFWGHSRPFCDRAAP